MKTKILYLLLIIPWLSAAQTKHFGASVGLNFAKFNGGDDFAKSLAMSMNYNEGFSGFHFDSKSRTGFAIGIFYNYPLKKSLSIQPEISYSQKGAKFKGDGYFEYYGDSYAVKVENIMRLNYLDITLMAKYHLSEGETRPYLSGGLGVGNILSSEMEVTTTVEGESSNETQSMDDWIKTTDVHFDIEGGLDFSSKVTLNLRYSLGLSNITKEDQEDLKNGVISLCMGLHF